MEFSLMHNGAAGDSSLGLRSDGWDFVGLLGLPAHQAVRPRHPRSESFPTPRFFFSSSTMSNRFGESFRSSQYGQLWNDPALKDFRDELAQRLEDGVQVAQGADRRQPSKSCSSFPKGALAIAAIGRDDPELPVAVAVIADAGENEKKLEEVLDAGDQAGRGCRRQGLDRIVQRLDAPYRPARRKKEAEKDDKEKDKAKAKVPPRPPLVWTNAGSLFFIGSDVEVVKDLAAHRDGRDNSLAATESFTKTQAKTDRARPRLIWYLDVTKVVKVVIKANCQGSDAQAQQTEVLVKELGVYGLKSVGGCFNLGSGNYDSLTKTFFHAPKPVAGLLKVFSLPPIALRPESWVPATVATYQTVSFDLDNALHRHQRSGQQVPARHGQPARAAAGRSQRRPAAQLPERRLRAARRSDHADQRLQEADQGRQPAHARGHRPRRHQGLPDHAHPALRDQPGPLRRSASSRERRSTISPSTFPIAPQGNGAPAAQGPDQHRDRQGHALHDHRHDLAGASAPAGERLPGRQHVVPDRRQGVPEKISGLSYVRPDESARLSYDMVKSGRSRKRPAGGGRQQPGREVPNLGKLIPVEKLPDFSVFAKYLSLGGSSSVMDDDGFTMTGFTLRKASP